MEWISSYIIKICGSALISFIVDMLLPEGNIKRTARFCASLIITVIVCTPLCELFANKQDIIVIPQTTVSADPLQTKQQIEKAITQLIKSVSGFENAQVTVTLSNGSPYSTEIYKNGNDAPVNKLNEQKIIELISVLYKISPNMIYIRN